MTARIIYKYFVLVVFVIVFVEVALLFYGNRTLAVRDTAARADEEHFPTTRLTITNARQTPKPEVPQIKPNKAKNDTRKTIKDINLRLQDPVVNPHPFRYLLNPEKFCFKKHIFIITYVHSAPEHFAHRDAIRRTWGKQKNYLNETVDVVFILGNVYDGDVMHAVKIESVHHGDIVVESFDDSYRNLTYKAIAGLKWVSTFCRHAKYVLKTDDDIVINFYVLMRYIKSTVQPNYGASRLILCCIWEGVAVLRDNRSKWYVSREEFSKDLYGPYCSGSAYFMSSDIPEMLLNVSLTTPFFWVDDYYVTGMLTEKLNISHRQNNKAYLYESVYFKKILKNDSYYEVYVICIKFLNEMFDLWDSIIKKEKGEVHAGVFNKLSVSATPLT